MLNHGGSKSRNRTPRSNRKAADRAAIQADLDELGDKDESSGCYQGAKGTNGSKQSGALAMVATVKVTLYTCLAPDCDEQFELPWGYYDDGQPALVGDPKKARWPGACSARCGATVERTRKEKAQREVEAFLARCAARAEQQPQLQAA